MQKISDLKKKSIFNIFNIFKINEKCGILEKFKYGVLKQVKTAILWK